MTEFVRLRKKKQLNKTAEKQQDTTGKRPLPPTASLSQPTQLQRTLGNQIVGRLLLQRKMMLGPVGDKYEQEADAVASQVMASLSNQPPNKQTTHPTAQRQEEEELQMKPLPAISAIQRQGEEEELQAKPLVQRQEEELQMKPLAQRQEEEEELQAKPLVQRQEEEEELQMKPLPAISTIQRQEEEELQAKPLAQRQEDEEELQMRPLAQRQEDEEELQAKGDPMLEGGVLGSDIEGAVQSARAGGRPLPAAARIPMERAFGADFSNVKVHTDGQADALNRSLQAHAFTTGSDIFFRSGEYNLASHGGQELIAHELTHVVQQNGPTVQPKPDDALQRQETGIAQDEAIVRYTGSAKKVFDDWSKLTPQKRANNLGKFVNDELKKAKSFPCNINLKDLGGSSGQFDFTTWTLDLDSAILNKDAVSDEEANDLVDTVYHEARHSEQWFRMAQLRAGEGRSAKQIADELFIPANVAKEAANAPLEPLSEPARKLLSEEAAKLHDKKLLEAKAWYKSVYGEDAAHRNEVLSDIDNRYHDYRALAEEVDAWNVGGRVAAAFKLLQVIEKIL